MTHQAITAFSSRFSPLVPPGKIRLQTLSLLIVAMISARTVNLSHLAFERAGSVLISSSHPIGVCNASSNTSAYPRTGRQASRSPSLRFFRDLASVS